MEIVRQRLKTVKSYLVVSDAREISQRYFVMNAFDGAMVMLGAIIGAYVVGSIDPKVMVGVGLGASLAMGISGFWGAYLTEKAMREKKIKELEKALFADLDGSFVENASKTATLWIAIVDALSPALVAIISIVPFVLALHGILSISTALTASLLLIIGILFVLGTYLGKISRGNLLTYGIYMTSAGVVTALIVILIGGW